MLVVLDRCVHARLFLRVSMPEIFHGSLDANFLLRFPNIRFHLQITEYQSLTLRKFWETIKHPWNSWHPAQGVGMEPAKRNANNTRGFGRDKNMKVCTSASNDAGARTKLRLCFHHSKTRVAINDPYQ